MVEEGLLGVGVLDSGQLADVLDVEAASSTPAQRGTFRTCTVMYCTAAHIFYICRLFLIFTE